MWIHSNCCKGVISLVGKGGAIRVQHGSAVLVDCYFEDNTASLLGGAIFVDLVGRLTMDNVTLVVDAVSRHAVDGDLVYSNGNVTVESARLIARSASDHVSVLCHSGTRWVVLRPRLRAVPQRHGVGGPSTTSPCCATAARGGWSFDHVSVLCHSGTRWVVLRPRLRAVPQRHGVGGPSTTSPCCATAARGGPSRRPASRSTARSVSQHHVCLRCQSLELLLAYCCTLLWYCYHPLCLCLLFQRRLSFCPFYYCYVFTLYIT